MVSQKPKYKKKMEEILEYIDQYYKETTKDNKEYVSRLLLKIVNCVDDKIEYSQQDVDDFIEEKKMKHLIKSQFLALVNTECINTTDYIKRTIPEIDITRSKYRPLIINSDSDYKTPPKSFYFLKNNHKDINYILYKNSFSHGLESNGLLFDTDNLYRCSKMAITSYLQNLDEINKQTINIECDLNKKRTKTISEMYKKINKLI